MASNQLTWLRRDTLLLLMEWHVLTWLLVELVLEECLLIPTAETTVWQRMTEYKSGLGNLYT